MNSTHSSNVFVDWLDFTVQTGSGHLDSFSDFLLDLGFHVATDSRGSIVACTPESLLANSGRGSVRLSTTRGVDRISLSGQAVAGIRAVDGGWDGLLHWMSERPHHITRLDAAIDVKTDSPVALTKLRHKVGRSKGALRLGRREKTVTWMLGPSDYDGRETGTMYVGSRKRGHQVIARVYDKRHQVLQTGGSDIGDCLRYELEVRGDRAKPWSSPCLNDVYDPTSLFWHYSGGSLPRKPAGVLAWEPQTFLTFSPEPLKALSAYERVDRYLESSGVSDVLWRLTGGSSDDLSSQQRLNTVKHLVNLHLQKSERSSQQCEPLATMPETNVTDVPESSSLINLGGMGGTPMINS